MGGWQTAKSEGGRQGEEKREEQRTGDSLGEGGKGRSGAEVKTAQK